MSNPQTSAHVIGCDLGSQSLKGILVDPDGTPVWQGADFAYQGGRYPSPGFVEQDAGDWTSAMEAVVRALVRDSGVRLRRDRIPSIAAQLDGLVAVDGRGQPLGPAILWMDRRAVNQCRHLRDRTAPERVFEITGLNLDAAHVAPKAMWLRDHEPDQFKSASWLPSPGSHMVEQLTGERILDPTRASSTMLYDVEANEWSDELLGASELEPQRCSAACFRQAESSASSRPARRTGSASGPGRELSPAVATITPDAWGRARRPRGRRRRGGDRRADRSHRAEPDPRSERLVETHFHAHEGMWLVQNPGFVSGGSIRWCCEPLGIAGPEEFFELASTAPPGADGLIFLPCLGGATTPSWNDAARGVFAGLALNDQPAHLARAVVEGCVFAFRDVVDRLRQLGIATEEVRVVGGGARSEFWCQLKADISGRTLRCVRGDNATATGAAMLAGVAGGMFESLPRRPTAWWGSASR